MHTEYSVPDNFWSSFVQHFWQKKPTLIKNLFENPLASSEETLIAAIHLGNHYRAGDHASPVSVFDEHRMIMTEVGSYLPAVEDSTLEAYAERITRRLQDRRFGLIAENFQVHDASLWLRIRKFLHGLYRVTYLPIMDSKIYVFLGTYQKTPYGLHLGRSSNFMFVTYGRKRIRLWPASFFKNSAEVEHTTNYEDFLKDSIVLEGEAGDLLYWPSGYWHIGETDGELSVSISAMLFKSEKEHDDLMTHTKRMVDSRLRAWSGMTGVFPPLDGTQESVNKITEFVNSAMTTLREAAADSRLRQALQVSLFDYVSGFGFAKVPQPAAWRVLRSDDILLGSSQFPILWTMLSDERLVCSANGHSFTARYHPNIVRLLELLNTGKDLPLARAIQELATEEESAESVVSPRKIRLLLEKLLSIRAIKLAVPSTGIRTES